MDIGYSTKCGFKELLNTRALQGSNRISYQPYLVCSNNIKKKLKYSLKTRSLEISTLFDKFQADVDVSRFCLSLCVCVYLFTYLQWQRRIMMESKTCVHMSNKSNNPFTLNHFTWIYHVTSHYTYLLAIDILCILTELHCDECNEEPGSCPQLMFISECQLSLPISRSLDIYNIYTSKYLHC